MKANEFINEGSTAKIPAELKAAIKAELDAQVTSFRTNVLPLGFFQIYDIMNAVAMSNGVDQVDYKHDKHNHDVAAPYTPIERKMLQAAYTALGQPWDTSILDLTDDPDSQKPDGQMSPVIQFKGYAR
jgi:hypothetical protein